MQKIILIVVLCLGVDGNSSTNYEFTPFKSHPGIFFEDLGNAALANSEFKFILYYNLTCYWDEWAHIEGSISRLQPWFSDNINTVHEHGHCTEIIRDIRLLQNGINERNQLLRSSVRVKRAPLDFVGNLLGDVFGVLDQRDAAEYHQQITTLQSANSRAQTLLQKQTEVLDVTSNILKKEGERLNNQYQAIHQRIKDIDEHGEFIDLTLQLTLAIMIFRDTQDALIDVITDTHHGRLNTRLITPRQIREELVKLQQTLTPSVRLPPYQDHWAQLYKLMSLRGGIDQELAIFEIRLPLLAQQEFQMFRAIPVPTLHDDRFIYLEPTYPYLLVNRQRSWFYPMLEPDLAACQVWDEKLTVCSQKQPLHSKSSQTLRCEIGLFEHEEGPEQECAVKSILPSVYVVPLQQTNTWVIALPKDTTFDLTCADHLQTIGIQGSGLLFLEAGCTLRNKFLLINSQVTYTESKNASFLPRFNLSEQVKTNNVPVIAANLDPEFHRLDEAMKNLRAEEPWYDVTPHDIHHYSIAILVWITAIVVAIIWWKRKTFAKIVFPSASTSASNTSSSEPIRPRLPSV